MTSFVGGVFDSLHGASVYDMNNNGVTVKKAWFFFDNEVVCLGAGIGSSAAENVVTILNQSWLRGAVIVKSATAETPLLPWSSVTFQDPAWVFHDSTGYIIPNGGTLVVENQNQSGNWTAIRSTSTPKIESSDVFKAYFSHGVAASNSNYAYIVVPEIDIDACLSRRQDRNRFQYGQNSGGTKQRSQYLADCFS